MANLESRLLSHLMTANKRYALVEPGDHVMVCLSGGKDSWVMLHLLRLMQQKVPFAFTMVAVNLDQGHPGFPQQSIVDYLEREKYDYKMLSVDTYKVVLEKVPEGKTYCSLCSRLCSERSWHDEADGCPRGRANGSHHRSWPYLTAYRSITAVTTRTDRGT